MDSAAKLLAVIVAPISNDIERDGRLNMNARRSRLVRFTQQLPTLQVRALAIRF